MWDLRGNQFITGTSKVFWPFPFLHFCSSILLHSRQVLPGAGSLGGALSGVYSSWMAQPLQAPCSRGTPQCHLFFPIWPPCFTRNICCLFWGFVFSGHQMQPPPPALIFFCFCPHRCKSCSCPATFFTPCIFKHHGDSLSPNHVVNLASGFGPQLGSLRSLVAGLAWKVQRAPLAFPPRGLSFRMWWLTFSHLSFFKAS